MEGKSGTEKTKEMKRKEEEEGGAQRLRTQRRGDPVCVWELDPRLSAPVALKDLEIFHSTATQGGLTPLLHKHTLKDNRHTLLGPALSITASLPVPLRQDSGLGWLS